MSLWNPFARDQRWKQKSPTALSPEEEAERKRRKDALEQDAALLVGGKQMLDAITGHAERNFLPQPQKEQLTREKRKYDAALETGSIHDVAPPLREMRRKAKQSLGPALPTPEQPDPRETAHLPYLDDDLAVAHFKLLNRLSRGEGASATDRPAKPGPAALKAPIATTPPATAEPSSTIPPAGAGARQRPAAGGPTLRVDTPPPSEAELRAVRAAVESRMALSDQLFGVKRRTPQPSSAQQVGNGTSDDPKPNSQESAEKTRKAAAPKPTPEHVQAVRDDARRQAVPANLPTHVQAGQDFWSRSAEAAQDREAEPSEGARGIQVANGAATVGSHPGASGLTLPKQDDDARGGLSGLARRMNRRLALPLQALEAIHGRPDAPPIPTYGAQDGAVFVQVLPGGGRRMAIVIRREGGAIIGNLMEDADGFHLLGAEGLGPVFSITEGGDGVLEQADLFAEARSESAVYEQAHRRLSEERTAEADDFRLPGFAEGAAPPDWRHLAESFPDLSEEIRAMGETPGFAEGAEPPSLDELLEGFPDDSDRIAEELRKHLAEGGFEAAPGWLRGLQAQAIKAPPGGLTRENAARYTDGIRSVYQRLWYVTEAGPGNRLARPYPGFSPLDGAATEQGDKRGTVAILQVGDRVFPGANSGVWLTDKQTRGARQNKLAGQILRDVYGLPINPTSPAWHAEGQALLRAFMQTAGALPKTLEMFTDRKSCRDCNDFLPRLMEDIGVDKIDVISIQTGEITPIWRSGLGPR